MIDSTIKLTSLFATFCFTVFIITQFESFTLATSESNSSILNLYNENKTSLGTQSLTLQQVLEILNQQEILSTTLTPKSNGWSGIEFWNCSGKMVNIWYDDKYDSRPWIKHGTITPQGGECPRGPAQNTLNFIDGHKYDVVVSMYDMPGCNGDWPDDYNCGKEFLWNQYGNSSQIKWPYYIYR